MMLIRSVLSLAFALGTTASYAESNCPLPEGMKASVEITEQAISARASGLSRQALESQASPIARDKPWAAALVSEILSEVYAKPVLASKVHAAYRMEVCFLMQQHSKQSPRFDFDKAYPLLKRCETLEEGKPQIMCSMEVAHTVSGLSEKK